MQYYYQRGYNEILCIYYNIMLCYRPHVGFSIALKTYSYYYNALFDRLTRFYILYLVTADSYSINVKTKTIGTYHPTIIITRVPNIFVVVVVIIIIIIRVRSVFYFFCSVVAFFPLHPLSARIVTTRVAWFLPYFY